MAGQKSGCGSYGFFWSVKLCLEQRVDKEIPVDHPFCAWMMEHTSLLLNFLVRGHDGLTPWMRICGRNFGQPLVGIGESLLYRYPSKGLLHNPQGNAGPLGAEGVFVGYGRNSNSFLVSTTDGQIVACRSISRRPEKQRWNSEAIS